MKIPLNTREEEIKNIIAKEYFFDFGSTKIIGNIDFCISKEVIKDQLSFLEDEEIESYFWAEAKKGNKADIIESFIQLILTIGKAKTHEKFLPPIFLGAFDAEKIAFIEFLDISFIFNQNDFNWKITPSNHNTKEFKQLQNIIEELLNKNKTTFYFENDDKELRQFIKNNFSFKKRRTVKISITKNNFTTIYLKWLKNVKDSININWEQVKKANILDSDFYLADLLSKDNESIKDNLFVILKTDKYEFNKKTDDIGLFQVNTATFKDNQKLHNSFWMLYERPPKKEFWNYIIERRDLLVPQDIREIKGSYFTPPQWVELSQKYLADELGENWQDEYYIWDCCCGTGNLLNGLTNKYNIFASTLDKPDIDVIKDRIKNGANLLESHVFQFDFLNDSFEDKCPKELLDIINDEEKRKKLVIYINPPYAECGLARNGETKNKAGVSNTNKIFEKYFPLIKKAGRELYILFLIRIYKEIPKCILGEFSTIKHLSAPNFKNFRENFETKLKSLFLVPADTFDNVKGQFPIGFHIWDLKEKEIFKEITADVYNKDFIKLEDKKIISYDNEKLINDWIRNFDIESLKDNIIGYLNGKCNDFQHQNRICIVNKNALSIGDFHINISKNNLIQSCIYLSVRQCIKADWLNDRDQFLHPNNKWEKDKKFQSNCLVYTLFHNQNQIKSEEDINNFIPFIEKEIEPKNNFKSHFITDYIKENNIEFSREGRDILDAGRELYKYYHSQENSNPDASFYNIKEFFQDRAENGRMNNKSNDDKYNELLKELREKHKVLGDAIAGKVYEYEFLV